MKNRRGDDWKQWKSGWKYGADAPKNRQWNKDRKKLFKINGNGWWWFPTDSSHKEFIKKLKEDIDE